MSCLYTTGSIALTCPKRVPDMSYIQIVNVSGRTRALSCWPLVLCNPATEFGLLALLLSFP